MDEAATYDAYLEVLLNGETLAQVLDLPGCFAYGASADIATMALAAALPAYYTWLRRHDDYTPIVTGPYEMRVREMVRVPPRAFFGPDAEPMDVGDLDLGASLLEWAYADLGTLVDSMSDALAAPDARGLTPADWLDGLLRTQLWLLSRLEPQPAPALPEALPGGPRERLRTISQAAIACLRNTTADERECVLEHEGERWSLRKVLRRSVLEACELLAALEDRAGG
jgi:hypothetical protein